MLDFYLFRHALRDLMRPRKLFLSLVLALLPGAMAALWRIGAGDDFRVEIAYNLLCPLLIFGFILVILSVVFSTGALTQEMEQKTIVYLLTRPVARWRIALAKFAAAVVVITATVWLSCGLLALTTYGVSGMRASGLLLNNQIKNPKSFVATFKDTPDTLSFFLAERVLALAEKNDTRTRVNRRGERVTRRSDLKDRLEKYKTENEPEARLTSDLVRNLNAVIADEEIYAPERFEGITLSPATRALLDKKPTGAERKFLNRALLEDAYPEEITKTDAPLQQLKRDFLILPVGVLAYSALFLFLATLFQRPLIFGMLFAFGWESWVPSLPGNFGRCSIMAYLRVLAPHKQLDTGGNGGGGLMAIFNPATITDRMAWIVLGCLFVFSFIAALIVFSIREYTPRDEV